MKRHVHLLIGCVIFATSVQAGDDAKKQTIAYVRKLQTATGGFTATPPAPNIRIALESACHFRGGAFAALFRRRHPRQGGVHQVCRELSRRREAAASAICPKGSPMSSRPRSA